MNIKKKINQHKSFLIIILGAVSIFFTNIFLKKVLSTSDYGEYSLYITFLQMMGSFGLLGYEQVFLRISEPNKTGVIKTNKTLLLTIIIVWFVIGILSAFIFKKYYSNIEINVLFYIISALSITFSMFVFNVFRLDSKFLVSQIVLNSWRIFLGFLAVLILLKKISAIKLFVEYVSYGLLFIFILQFYYFVSKIKFDFSIEVGLKKINTYAFHFFISLFLLSLISFGDKFFVKTSFGVKELGNYFYLATIFVFPFSLIQSYIGFKELVAFKKDNSINNLNKKIILVTGFGLLLGIGIFSVAYLINKFDIIAHINIKDNLLLILIFMLTGIFKLNYSLFSALLGAKGNVKAIRNANIQSVISLLLLVLIFYNNLKKPEMVALFIALFWIFRTFIWNYNIKKQFR